MSDVVLIVPPQAPVSEDAEVCPAPRDSNTFNRIDDDQLSGKLWKVHRKFMIIYE